MNNAYLRTALISMAVHLFFVYTLIAFSLISWHRPRPRKDLMFIVHFQPGMPPGARAAPKPADTLALIREPSKTEPSKTAAKLKAAAKTNLVRKASSSSESRRPKKLSATQIRAMLESAVASVGPAPMSSGAGMPGEGAGSEGGAMTPYLWYLEQVRAIMYEAWQQPSALAGKQGLLARVLVRVQPDGQIILKKMLEPSGNSLMDDSVLAALEQVQALPEPPIGFGGVLHKDITIDFELEETVP